MSMHPNHNYFLGYKGENTVFVETGTYSGDGVQLAFEAGYDRIFTLEADRNAWIATTNRFKDT